MYFFKGNMKEYIAIILAIIGTLSISSCYSSQISPLKNTAIPNANNVGTLRRSNALNLTEKQIKEIDDILKEVENEKNEEKRTRRTVHAAISLSILIGININIAKEKVNNFVGSNNTRDFMQRLNDYFTLLKYIVLCLKDTNQKYDTQGNYSKEDLKNTKELLEAYRIYLEHINNLFKTNGASLLNNINDENKQKIQNKLSSLCVTFESFLKLFTNSASNENIKLR